MNERDSILLLIVAIVLGLIPALIARFKGRNFFAWWIFGTLLFIVALPAAFLIGPTAEREEEKRWSKYLWLHKDELKKCPGCAALVRTEATECHFCGHRFDNGKHDDDRPRKS